MADSQNSSKSTIELDYADNDSLKEALGVLKPGDTVKIMVELVATEVDDTKLAGSITNVEVCECDDSEEEGDSESEDMVSPTAASPVMILMASKKDASKGAKY